MPHGPAYNYDSHQNPPICWHKHDGTVVGFWPHEWLDILGKAVLKESDRYEWEVWQPDYRADSIHSKMLETGVTHRLFPAEERIYRPGLRVQKGIFSRMIISHLRKRQNDPIILMLYCTYGFRTPFYNEILQIFGPTTRKFPILFRSGGMFRTPISEIYAVHRPLTYLCLLVEHIRLKKLINYSRIDVISEQSDSALKEVRKVYNGRIEKLTMGCDFDFWVPASSGEVKRSIQRDLNIPEGKTVFFASGNFVARKQLDKLLRVCKSIQDRDDFFLIIAGHGDETNTKLLTSLAEPLIGENKALLHPYVTGKHLRNLYWASDVYISVATDEGGPVSVMKAMACGLPVMSTPVGETADRMKKHNAGKFVPVKKYDDWARTIIEVCELGLPEPININTARDAYHWPNVAQRFLEIFDDLSRTGH
jgi:glycosyltransferase involved in cell wall biosynthesis